jgi:hypothetical protein
MIELFSGPQFILARRQLKDRKVPYTIRHRYQTFYSVIKWSAIFTVLNK